MAVLNDELIASLLGLHVTGVGARKQDVSYPLSWLNKRVLKGFAIIYIWKGRGEFESETTGIVPVEKGTVFFLFPGVWHQYGTREGDTWREYWMTFDGFIPQQYVKSGILDPNWPLFNVGVDQEMVKEWDQAAKIFKGKKTDRIQLLSEKLFGIFRRTFAHARIKDTRGDEEWQTAHEIIALMENHIQDMIFPLQSYSKHFAKSYSTLRKIFKKITGYAPAKYFDQIKITRAKSRLLSTEDPIKEIAADLGFTDPYHFSRRFKTLVGISPENFRNEFR